MEKNKPNINWLIHYVGNGVRCDVCGKEENSFPHFMCNIHTHGMEQYGHLDFQIVIDLGMSLAGTLLNDMGLRVQSGQKFKVGDVISDLIVGYDVKLVGAMETNRNVLRLIFPDKNGSFPENDTCEYPYNRQYGFETNSTINKEE